MGQKTYNFQTLKQYRTLQVIIELTWIIEFKRHIESSFENKIQNIFDLFKEKLKQKISSNNQIVF